VCQEPPLSFSLSNSPRHPSQESYLVPTAPSQFAEVHRNSWQGRTGCIILQSLNVKIQLGIASGYAVPQRAPCPLPTGHLLSTVLGMLPQTFIRAPCFICSLTHSHVPTHTWAHECTHAQACKLCSLVKTVTPVQTSVLSSLGSIRNANCEPCGEGREPQRSWQDEGHSAQVLAPALWAPARSQQTTPAYRAGLA
jgi:hypothetical protein